MTTDWIKCCYYSFYTTTGNTPAQVKDINHDIAGKLSLFISGDIDVESNYGGYIYINLNVASVNSVIIYTARVKIIHPVWGDKNATPSLHNMP
ncbi:hypothetical protein [Pantoea piersonii]|uniref:hypothetical protein n=1 Tax=Pantoea piersonii TaxID=2364647 RepID=UPI002897D60A|nr:hypothetical protein [Pantoea piersonii]